MDVAPAAVETRDYEKHLDLTRPPAEVFTALSTPTGVSAWWMPTTGSGEEGGELVLDMPPGPLVLRVDVAEAPREVAWSVLRCDFMPDWVGTAPVFVLHPTAAGGTGLAFRHRGLTPRLECYGQCRQGWDHYLASLRDHVETGGGTIPPNDEPYPTHDATRGGAAGTRRVRDGAVASRPG